MQPIAVTGTLGTAGFVSTPESTSLDDKVIEKDCMYDIENKITTGGGQRTGGFGKYEKTSIEAERHANMIGVRTYQIR